ncbi:Putative L,D-transpeptidase YkuD [Cytospora mali]|uniref:L,D-transpeptidase YkuD n=1 Tax=Cytospora mali TaxID=578113 RepID=A0A194VGW8_CYTMA|nr:Putative L,D-transpeptidase YkuD [Valsa mali var. pyri (nom. inval.)]
MPSRYMESDTDEERLPEGMVRIGYDADTQVYTFRDADGSIWEGPPGSRYGSLTKIAEAPKPPSDLENIDVEAAHAADQPPPYDESEATQPFLNHYGHLSAQNNMRQGWGDHILKRHWRAELMPLLNFFFILALFLMGLFWFLGWMAQSSHLSSCEPGSHAHQIQKKETCWSIANMHGISVDKLIEANQDINCDLLWVGATVCVPAMPKP